MMTAKIIRV